MSSRNVYTVDASNIDTTDGLVVPRDVESVDDTNFELDRDVKEEWEIKVVNDADQSVDSTPLISTSDDENFTEYDEVDQLAATVSTGDPPTNVDIQDSDLVASKLCTRLDVGTSATGNVKIVFEDRKMAQN